MGITSRGTKSGSRLWTSRLWIIAGVLGALSLFAMVSTVHGERQQRQAAHVVVLAKAEQVAERASHRFELRAQQTFAPGMIAGASLDAVVQGQRNAERCGCRFTLPSVTFFRYDLRAKTIEIRPATDGALPLPSSAILVALAERDVWRRGTAGVARPRLWVDSTLGGWSVVTLVQDDAVGAPVAVHGLVANARGMASALFGPELVPRASADPHGELALLDSASLLVVSRDSMTLFGRVDPARVHLRVRVHPLGPLEDLRMVVALEPRQIAAPLLAPIPQQALWHLGALLAATILVIGIAIGASRREALLARARSDFIAGVSHDLRMPLAQILIAGETLAMQRERDEAQRLGLASSIVREARRLITLVENVLLFSRSGAVALRPQLGTVRVADIFEDVVEAVQLAVDDAAQTIDASSGGDLSIIGDRALVRQALVNLVDNALKYGSSGQRIRLGMERHGDAVRLFVDDDGPGVPRAERARVFEAYERLARDQTSERTGTGLGLAVVSHIARVSGGRVWLEDGAGGGTRAVLELPASDTREPTRVPAAVS